MEQRNCVCLPVYFRHVCIHSMKGSFFPQIIRDWNNLSESEISSPEIVEDCVAKFTSLVGVRD